MRTQGRQLYNILDLLSERERHRFGWQLEPQTIISQLQAEMPDFLEARLLLVDLLAFVERKAPEADVRTAAEVLGARLKNQRFGI